MNHPSALDEYDLAIMHAQKLGDSDTIQQAFKESCDSCIALEEYDNALLFFEKALSCDIQSMDTSVPSIHHLEWICKVVALPTISVTRATECIPFAYIAALRNHPKLTSCQFQSELEGRWFSLRLHRLHVPVNDTVASSSNAGPIVCEEEGQYLSPVNNFAAFSPNEELLMQPAVVPFSEMVEIPPSPCLCDADNGTNVAPVNVNHDYNDMSTGSYFMPFPYYHDPYYNVDQ